MLVFLSYAHSKLDADFVRFLAKGLRACGIDPWLDEERLPPGRRLESTIRDAIERSDAAIFVISREWRERDFTQWELDQFKQREPRCDRLIGILRGEAHEKLERLIPPGLAGVICLPWPRESEDTDALFWRLHCGITGEETGDRETWAEQGRAALGGTAAPPPPAPPPPAFLASGRVVAPGQKSYSLRCDRSQQWGIVDAHAREDGHELLVVHGPCGRGHDHFAVRIYDDWRKDPPRTVCFIDWQPRPRTQGDFVARLLAALGDTQAAGDARARAASLIRTRLLKQNLVLIHPTISLEYDDRELRTYYRETLPALVQEAAPARSLKAVQLIEWRETSPVQRTIARLMALLWPGSPRSGWVAEGLEEAEAARLVTDLKSVRTPPLKTYVLPPLGSIPEDELDMFCERLNLSQEQKQRLIARVRSAHRTREDVFRALDKYCAEFCAPAL
jgi:hypothetical protein